jgi:hypothetical protein
MPDCVGLDVDACESAIASASALSGKTVSFTVTTADVADPTVARDLVLSTTPAVAAHSRPDAITITKNASDASDPICTWAVQNPHVSTGTPGAVVVKGVAECNYTTSITGTLSLWKCDAEPSGSLTDLQAGNWGCVVVAATTEERLAKPAVLETFQAPPPGGDVIAADSKWFIAYGTLDKGTPSAAFSNIVQLSG